MCCKRGPSAVIICSTHTVPLTHVNLSNAHDDRYWEREGDALQKGTLSLASTQSIQRSRDAASMHLKLMNRKGVVQHHELRAETSLAIEQWILAIGTQMSRSG